MSAGEGGRRGGEEEEDVVVGQRTRARDERAIPVSCDETRLTTDFHPSLLPPSLQSL